MRQVMNDPVHGLMEFGGVKEEWAKYFKVIIDHPFFQRLRHIKQLGMADLVFPGAVHTRFNHSIGVMQVASRVIAVVHDFLDKPLDPEEALHLKLFCLLHDIGHGPCSHAFEHLTLEQGLEPITHEDWAPYFLKAFPPMRFPKEPVWKEIIASQLDADRMDYLLRDALFCGVAYGQFDLAWVIHCLRPVTHKGAMHLGISYKGISAVEAYLLARRLMTQNVYHHPKIKRAQMMMMEFLKGCCEAINSPAFENLRKNPFGKFLVALKAYRSKACSKTVFMEQAFLYYQQLTDHHVYACLSMVMADPDHYPSALHMIAKRLYQRQLPAIVPIEVGRFSEVAEKVEALKQKHGLASWQLGVEQPFFSTYSEAQSPILVEYPSGLIEDLGQNALLQATSTTDPESATLYLDKPLMELKRLF